MLTKNILLSGVAAVLISGCAGGLGQMQQFGSDHKRALIAGAVGTGVGALIGSQVGDEKGALIGAGLGALAGGAIGHYMDNQQRQLQQQVQGTGIGVSRVDQGTLKLNIPSEVLFAVNQSQITPRFYPVLNKIAQTLNQYPQTIVHVYGFTDGSGSPQYNMQLSQQRAQNAAQYLAAQGVNSQRFVVRGYGEQFATSQNNPQERRVEIFIKAVNQANPQAAYTPVY